jgi:glucosamine--fructose-6-phosphate aminotransferase (isomerizing)
MDQLRNQKELARDHLSTAWPAIKDQAAKAKLDEAIQNVIVCGCGDSHHAASALSFGFSALAPVHCQPAHSMHAARYLLPELGEQAKHTLVIAISASGEVARTIEALEMAASVGANTLAFTGNAGGTLARTAQRAIVFAGPQLPHGPGLISYLSSLLMGYALIYRIAETPIGRKMDRAITQLFTDMEPWIEDRWERGVRFAESGEDGTCVFIGSGPAYASALFGAAKLLEASGEPAWGQDVEEWAHLEYFGARPDMRTWLLSAAGRSFSRELEVRAAAEAIGRRWHEDRWQQLETDFGELNEILAPLVLWAGPCGYAWRRTTIRGETPFRNFSGGRDRAEGGGASRIRSSARSVDYGENG